MSHRLIHADLPEYGIRAENRIKRPEFAHSSHSHNHASLLYVVSGQGILEFSGTRYDLSSHSVVVLPGQQEHTLLDKPRNPMTVFSIYFDLQKAIINQDIPDQLIDYAKPLSLPLYHAEQIKRFLRQILYEQKTRPSGYDWAIQQIFNLTMLQLHRAKLELPPKKSPSTPPTSTERVQSVLDFIASNSHEQYTLANAARLARISQRQFTNICRKITSRSYIQFLNQQRCNMAKRLLETTEMSVSSIAFEVGYEDLSTFYRAFKGFFEVTPLQLRKDSALTDN